MNIKNVLPTAAWVAALALGAVLVAPVAASADQAFHYTTNVQPSTGANPVAGKLDIEITHDGIVKGTYHSVADNKALIPVTGKMQGSQIWLDIGPATTLSSMGTEPGGRVHIVGTIATSGVITGTAYPNYAGGQGTMAQETMMQTSGASHDQYDFSAKPVSAP
jgi:hypothetical protein